MNDLELLPEPRELELSGTGCAGEATPEERTDTTLPVQGYALDISPEGLVLSYSDESGRRYARAALEQIRRQSGARLPGLRIRDWPDFPVRGYMLDVSRDRVPTRATLERLLELLALLRINHFELYTEHSFAYRDHESVWRDASPLTHEDVRWLDSLCRERGIELSANQQSFGHMGRWLAHERYRHLAEAPDGWETSRGRHIPPGVLAPDQQSLEFVLSLWRELLPCFTSRRVNVGCDETFELGRGRSRASVARDGRGRVYLDFVLCLLEALHGEGCEVLFWGDVVREHPELVPRLPERDTTALVWHYEAPADPSELPEGLREAALEFGFSEDGLRGFEARVPVFAARGFPFWVCPGTSGWNALVGRWPNARANLLDAARVGLERGAGGYLITDWGDNGHWQPPSVSFLPLAYGAAVSWCQAANRDLEMASRLSRFVFDDSSGALAPALEAIGGAYAGTGLFCPNASPLHARLSPAPYLTAGEASESGVRAVLERLDDAAREIARSQPRCPDGDLVRRELLQAIRLARHGAWRIGRDAGFATPMTAELARDLEEAIEEQRACWLLRSRRGGLDQSLRPLEATLARYRN